MVVLAISPFGDGSGKKVLVLLSASVERFWVSRMRDLKKMFAIFCQILCSVSKEFIWDRPSYPMGPYSLNLCHG